LGKAIGLTLTLPHSYHSSRTLLLMKKYRMGRVQEPWSNLSPPIRSPDYYEKLAARKKAQQAEGKSSRRSKSVDLTSAAAVLQKKLSTTSTCTRRTVATVSADPEKLPLLPETPNPAKAKEDNRNRYALEVEQKEREEGWAANPPVDTETQRAIILEYRALHQRIIDAGLYKCNYLEYGKECMRYSALFGTFLFLLNAKWYLTSGVPLGLFWVCCVSHTLHSRHANPLAVTDHVLSPRRRSHGYHLQLCH
jgi:delta8-fatty-acid desaturase